jgi:hypothetical protein
MVPAPIAPASLGLAGNIVRDSLVKVKRGQEQFPKPSE